VQGDGPPLWQAFDALLAAADEMYAAAVDDEARRAATMLIDVLESAVAQTIADATGTARP
jgi:hypothetical protein